MQPSGGLAHDYADRPLRVVLTRSSLEVVGHIASPRLNGCVVCFPEVSAQCWTRGVIRCLIASLLPMGWRRSDENNYSIVVDPAARMAIAVAPGDEGIERTYQGLGRPNTSEAVNAD